MSPSGPGSESSADVLNYGPDKGPSLLGHGLPLLRMLTLLINMVVKQSRSETTKGQRATFSIDLAVLVSLSV